MLGTLRSSLSNVSDTLDLCLHPSFSQPNSGGFMTGSELLQKRKACFRLSTGSKAWDGILNGGLQSMSINEVYGEYRCGKTQLAHTLCVVAQLPRERGGAEGRVAYIGS